MAEKTPMEQISEQIVGQLKRGEAPWQKSSGVNHNLPFNPESGTVYHGINQVILSAQGHDDDPRWMTFKQADKAGYSIAKGAKSQKVGFWQFERDGRQNERPTLRYFPVFHASQLRQKNGQDIPAFTPLVKESAFDRRELGEHLGAYRNEHQKAPRGSAGHAMEELRLQMASWMLSRELGLPFEPEPSEHFSKEWIKALEADKMALSRAARDAEKIKERILGMKRVQEQKQETNLEAAPEPKPAAEKTFLAVLFEEKDAARELGAKWDSQAKLWYAPEGVDMARLEKYLPEKEPTPVKTMAPDEEFAQALAQAGFKLNGPPIMDGKLQRVAVEGGKYGAKDGAYCGYLDGRPNGWMQNYKTGVKDRWVATGQVLTEEQRTALKAEAAERAAAREREREAGYKAAMAAASKKFALAGQADAAHPYLAAKVVKSFDLRMDMEGNLLVPAYDIQKKEIQTIQTITPEGKKYFEAGCPKKGAMLILNSEGALGQSGPDLRPDIQADPGLRPEILVAEGYATAASLHQATGLPVAVAFDSGNLLPVAQKLRAQFPELAICLCADNDHGQEQNVGLLKAEEAAKAVDGRMVAPLFNKKEMAKGLTDFNDYHQSRGLDALKKAFSRSNSKSLMNQTWERLNQAAQGAAQGAGIAR